MSHGEGMVREHSPRRRAFLLQRTIAPATKMYRLSILLFAVAAVAGLTMAVMHFKNASPPRPVLAVLHGLFAASGLVVLLLAVIKVGMQGAPAIALGLLVIAALGGFGIAELSPARPRLAVGARGGSCIAGGRRVRHAARG